MMTNNLTKPVLMLLIAVFTLISCGGDDEEQPGTTPQEKPSTELNGVTVSTWMYQIQNLDENDNIDELDNTEYDMLVVEPGHNFSDYPYNTDYVVSALKQKPNGSNRILLAYIDIGQAEDYRDYWQDDWVPPTATQPGNPDFLVTIDPDGWSGNYPVAYWDTAWQNIWLCTDGIIEQLADFGFDGVYLDWVEAYDDDKVREVAQTENINTEEEMMLFIQRIRNKGKSINSGFLIIPQNAPYLLDANPGLYTSIIDAVATEDTWYYGEADADWNSSSAGDLSGGERHSEDYSTENRILQNKKYLQLGIPVFTVDYCISEQNANETYNNSRENGFIPLVTRVSLSEITETPPF